MKLSSQLYVVRAEAVRLAHLAAEYSHQVNVCSTFQEIFDLGQQI